MSPVENWVRGLKQKISWAKHFTESSSDARVPRRTYVEIQVSDV